MNGLSRIRTDYANINELVDVAPIAEAFTQAAEDLDIHPDDLAEEVGKRIGFVTSNYQTGSTPDEAVAQAGHGVLYLLGLQADRFGATRKNITAGRTTQIGYVLRLIEDELTE